MFRAVPADLCRGLVFVVTALSCLLAITGDSRAGGCHVPERPVLAQTLSWENELVVDSSTAPPVLAPPVLIHPPCQGEVPRWLGAAGRPLAAPGNIRSASTRPVSPGRCPLALPPSILNRLALASIAHHDSSNAESLSGSRIHAHSGRQFCFFYRVARACRPWMKPHGHDGRGTANRTWARSMTA